MADSEESELRTIRQADYDAYLNDMMQTEGLNIEEAAEQAIESISSQYEVHNLFLYRNQREFDEKIKIEKSCLTIEKAGLGKDSFINANFAFQGLKKVLKDGDVAIREGIWHLLESRKLLRSLVILLKVPEEDDSSKKPAGEIDSDSDGEDEDEDKILQTVAVLDFANSTIELALASPQYVHNVELFCTLDEELTEILKSRLDEDIADVRWVKFHELQIKFFCTALAVLLPLLTGLFLKRINYLS